MLTRIVSGIVLLFILVVVLLKGGVYIYIGATVCSLIALHEYFKVFRDNGYRPLEITCYISTIAIYSMVSLSKLTFSHIVLNAIYVIVVVAAYHIIRKKIRVEDLMVSLLGFIYIPVFLCHVNLLSNIGPIYVWLVCIFAWGTDTSAYFAGMFFGKTKLIPEISPKKTVEGAIGGIFGTTIITVIFAVMFNEPNPMYFVPLAVVGSVSSQLGDLFASAIKREFNIKDYGNFIPGHGGMLDRIDSVLFAAPLTYYGVILIDFVQKLG